MAREMSNVVGPGKKKNQAQYARKIQSRDNARRQNKNKEKQIFKKTNHKKQGEKRKVAVKMAQRGD